MFGNTTGWIISAVIAALGFYGGYTLLQAAEPTSPTREPWTLLAHKPLDLTDVATAALPAMDQPKEDAADLYRQAAADFDTHRDEYTALQTVKDFDPKIESMAGVNLICQATACSSMHLFTPTPEEVVGFDSTIPVLDKLTEIEAAMNQAILFAKAQDAQPPRLDLAKKYALAIEAMGYRLYKERLALIELDAGEKFMGDANELLIEIAQAEHNESAGAAQTALKIRRLEEANSIITEVRKYMTSQGQSMIGKYAGDVFVLAQDASAERMWRVEAIRKVGRMQFNAESSADQRKAPKMLRKLADDKTQDAIVRATAARALAMTPYDNQAQR